MANLSSYIDFSIVFDKSLTTPVIRLTDPNHYPAPVYLYMSGVFTITQPDGITITGSFSSPDIYWLSNASGSGLVTATKELRLATDGSIQQGLYTFTYTVRCTGYTDTVLTKTFTCLYVTPTVAVTNLVDVFTPAIQLLDGTYYSQPNFTTNLNAITRAWSANIKYVGSSAVTVTGSSILFDIKYGGNYYDAHYDTTFSATFSSVGVLITYLTIIDKITADTQLDPYTPPSLAVLLTGLNTLKSEIDAGTYCGGGTCPCACDNNDDTYALAVSLYEMIIANGLAGDTVGLDAYVWQLVKIFNCSGLLNQTHTNTVIPAYNFSNGSSGSVHAPIQFTVDSGGTYAPTAGTQAYNNPTISGQNNFTIYRQAVGDYLVEGTDYSYNVGGGFTLIGTVFVSAERFTLIFYPPQA